MMWKMKFAASALALALFAHPASAADMAVASNDWTGLYVGATGGAVNGEVYFAESDEEGHTNSASVFSIIAGYNFAFGDNFVLGIEGDYSFGTLEFCGSGCDGHRLDTDTLASVRARAGFALSDQTLVFATVGAGWIDGTYTSSAASKQESFSLVRPVAGLGLDHALTDSINLRVEAMAYLGEDEIQGQVTEPADFKTVYMGRAGFTVDF
jgi:outer membrane immunogenic protein